MIEKARELWAERTEYVAGDKQYFVKSKSGKSWELWDESNTLKLVCRIPARRIYWVFPLHDGNAENVK